MRAQVIPLGQHLPPAAGGQQGLEGGSLGLKVPAQGLGLEGIQVLVRG